MGELTKIQWTDHTFNPWRGCSKVHIGCTHCYAESQSKRNPGVLGIWGDQGTRVVASEAMWGKPLKWNAAAKADGVRRRVFCASLADVFEDWEGWVLNSRGAVVWWCDDCRVFARIGDSSHGACCVRCGSGNGRQATLYDVRRRLFQMIDDTPWLDWLLLTKRPENIRKWIPQINLCPVCSAKVHDDETGQGRWCLECGRGFAFEDRRQNVWLGTSISDQETADKAVPELLKCRDLAPVLFLSAEPLVGPITLRSLTVDPAHVLCALTGNLYGTPTADLRWKPGKHAHIDWVIVGGESGSKARPCDLEWIRYIVKLCQAAEVPVFVKQLGAVPIDTTFRSPSDPVLLTGIKDPKGGDPDEWPEDLRVREFPEVQ